MSSEISKINEIKIADNTDIELVQSQEEQEVKLWESSPKENNYNKLPNNTEVFLEGLEYLSTSINDSYINYLGYEKGFYGSIANGFKEIFGFKSAQSKVEPIILEEKEKIDKLISRAKHLPGTFRSEYKKLRGVEFNIENIRDFEAKKEEFADISEFNDIKTAFDKGLESSLKEYEAIKNGERASNLRQEAINKYSADEIKKDLVESLKLIYKSNEEIGNHILSVSEKLGIDLDEKMTPREELEAWATIAKTYKEKLNKSYEAFLDGKSFKEYQQEYEDAYKKAYGETNAKELSDAYLKTQRTGEQVAKVAVIIATSVGTMGVATAIKGASLTTKTAFALSTATPGFTTTTADTVDDYLKDGRVDNFKEHITDGAKVSGYSAIGFGSGAISQSVKGLSRLGKTGLELTMDATGSYLFGKATGDNQTLGENFLYSGVFILPGMVGARYKSNMKPAPEVSINNKKEILALPKITQTRLDNMENYARYIEGKGKIDINSATNEVKNVLPEDMQSSLHARPKGECSTHDKLLADLKRKNITDLKSSIQAVDDLIGTRLVLDDASPKEIDRVVESLEEGILNGDIIITEVRNYRGRNGCEYFTDGHIETLENAVKERYKATGEGPDRLGTKEKKKEIKDSGYTTTQMKIIHQQKESGFATLGEFQIRGKHINEFADVEHIPYDLREGKDLSKGNKELAKIYEPIENTMKNMSEADYKEYNEYLSALYKYYRNVENGTPNAPISVATDKYPIINHYPAGEKPQLPAKFDERIGEDGLHSIHKNVKAKKKELGIE